MYRFDKDQIKASLTIDDIVMLLEEFAAEPKIVDGNIIAKTICHNGIGEGSHKLYYYSNSRLFHCYSGCEEPSFDVFGLVSKVLSQATDKEWDLAAAIKFVTRYFGIVGTGTEDDDFEQQLEDWHILEKYEKDRGLEQEKKRELKLYDEDILKNIPQPIIQSWVDEGISYEVQKYNNIKFDPVNCVIVVPHYDVDGNLIGIRQRTLIEEEEIFGKWRPWYNNGKLYNHPLSFALYNLCHSKDNIKKIEKAIVFESEKSCMKYQTMFGIENDISVAVCGFNLLNTQVKLLTAAGAKEIVIALDKQYKEIGDDEWKSLTKKYYQMQAKYGADVQLSFMFDDKNLLKYKDSPIDEGREKFLQLFKERRFI